MLKTRKVTDVFGMQVYTDDGLFTVKLKKSLYRITGFMAGVLGQLSTLS